MDYSRTIRPRPPARRTRRRLRVVLLVCAVLAGLFVLANAALLIMYNGKTYPGVLVSGKPVGGVTYGAVPERLKQLDLLPASLALRYVDKQQSVAAASLGLAVDVPATQALLQQRHWLPAWNLARPVSAVAVLTIDDTKLVKQLTELQTTHKETAVNAHIESHVEQGAAGFVLVPAQLGSTLDIAKSRQAVAAAARSGAAVVTLVVTRTQPAVPDAKLAPPLKKLQAAQATKLTYTYGGKSYTPAAADIASWYRGPKDAAETGNYTLSEGAMRAYLALSAKQAGARLTNTAQAAAATKAALQGGEPLNFALQGAPAAPVKTYRYCTAVKGVDAKLLPELDSRLLTTYADERGWTSGGAVDFVHAGAGCDFTVWLSAASQMASFGAICDSEWSCTVSPNVIINYDRWQGATDSWNAAWPGNLDDYRAMAINHETGHWLGFNHVSCGGAGQLAPVMQQQSINLGGCSFNPWPLASEQAALRAQL